MCDIEASLAAHEQHLRSRFGSILAEGVARDLGEPADSLRPRLVASAAVAALSAIDKEGADRSQSMALLDETLVFLRGGVAALQQR
jgi:MftR C-terminal domain